jgi:hypothetical protein
MYRNERESLRSLETGFDVKFDPYTQRARFYVLFSTFYTQFENGKHANV